MKSQIKAANQLQAAFDTLREFSNWFATLAEDGPCYALPAALLDASDFQSASWISPEDFEAEATFSGICEQFDCVGVSRNADRVEPIWYDLLPFGLEILPPEDQLGVIANDYKEKLSRIAGFLVTCPEFLRERDCLRRLSAEAGDPRTLPLSPLPAVQSQSEVVLTDFEVVEQCDSPEQCLEPAVRALCNRWAVQELTTWDLPRPFGPQFEAPRTAAAFRPDSRITIELPLHFPLQDSREIAARIVELQEAEADRRNLPTDFALAGSQPRYRAFLALQHFERVLTERYAPDQRPRGFVEWALRSIANLLCISPQTAKNYREELRSRLRGYDTR